MVLSNKVEHELYPWVIEQFARDRVVVANKSAIGGSSRLVVIHPEEQ